MALCSACVRLARILSAYSGDNIRDIIHSAEPGNPLKSAKDCRLCKFLISCIGSQIYSSVDLDIELVKEKLFSRLDRWGLLGSFKYSILQPGICSFNVGCGWGDDICFRLLFWAKDGSPPSTSGLMHVGPPALDPIRIIDRISRWLRECRSDHNECTSTISGISLNESVDPPLPSRVLDLGQGERSHYVRLLQTNGICGQYCALSHCWGSPDNPPLRTTRTTLQKHVRGIRIMNLPQTFKDAVTITRGIGVRYLWIDSLCIVQDDKEDWRAESREMGKVYERAVLTIAASGAQDSSRGCFIAKSHDLHSERVPYLPDFHDASLGSFYLHQIFDTSPYWGCLQKRGWAFQEWRLSRRVVHFTEGGISWKCKEEEQDQYGNSVDLQQYPEWDFLLQDYCDAEFTYEKDRLVALQGLASEMQIARNDHYFYGMWTGDFPEHLLWMRMGSFADGPLDVPSWTWAAKLGPRIFWSTQFSGRARIGYAISSEAIGVEESGVMTINNAYLRRCKILQRTVSHDSQDGFKDTRKILRSYLQDTEEEPGYLYSLEPSSDSPFGLVVLDGRPSLEMYCLLVMQTEVKDLAVSVTGISAYNKDPLYWVLVLQSTNVDPLTAPSFSRVGIGISLSGLENEGWSNFPTIKIV